MGVCIPQQRSKIWWERKLSFGCVYGELVEEWREKVRVVDGHGKFDENILVSESALLEASNTVSILFPI